MSWATQEDKDEYIAWYVNNVVTEEDTTGNAYAPDENGEYHRDDNDIDFLRDLNDIAWK